MTLTSKQLELALTVPAIVGLLPAKRQELILQAGKDAAALLAAGLTISEQKAAIAVADLFLQFSREDPNHLKWSELMEAAIEQDAGEQYLKY
ncbi:MAG TPA: hypothetical protein DCP36_03985 [Sporomusaceae bacterium]|uniref:hypothetical protein n=1 Tax=Anaerospora sp. TaxID=1960278 RepID=UPI000EE359CB|nr:hypothetical protein [Anaerospora sp.]MDF2930228.1 hypothetical protein [Anaerospora sp.]HAK72948.1 hypothetical protein [Sporomusaceae bacterium]